MLPVAFRQMVCREDLPWNTYHISVIFYLEPSFMLIICGVLSATELVNFPRFGKRLSFPIQVTLQVHDCQMWPRLACMACRIIVSYRRHARATYYYFIVPLRCHYQAGWASCRVLQHNYLLTRGSKRLSVDSLVGWLVCSPRTGRTQDPTRVECWLGQRWII